MSDMSWGSWLPVISDRTVQCAHEMEYLFRVRIQNSTRPILWARELTLSERSLPLRVRRGNHALTKRLLGILSSPQPSPSPNALLVCVPGPEEHEVWVVAPSAMIRRVRVTDSFGELQSLEKNDLNHEFALAVAESLQKTKNPEDFHILYLDSPACLTTMMLRAATRAQTHQLHIPHLVDVDQGVRDHATWYPSQTFFELIRDASSRRFEDKAFVGYDACCRWEGNQSNTRPAADLALLFDRRFLRRDGGILWVTFSRRGSHFDPSQVEQIILDLAWTCGQYKLERIGSRRYGKMFTFLWKSQKIQKEPEKEKEDIWIDLTGPEYNHTIETETEPERKSEIHVASPSPSPVDHPSSVAIDALPRLSNDQEEKQDEEKKKKTKKRKRKRKQKKVQADPEPMDPSLVKQAQDKDALPLLESIQKFIQVLSVSRSKTAKQLLDRARTLLDFVKPEIRESPKDWIRQQMRIQKIRLHGLGPKACRRVRKAWIELNQLCESPPPASQGEKPNKRRRLFLPEDVLDIKEEKAHGCMYQALILWHGYPKEESTYEPMNKFIGYDIWTKIEEVWKRKWGVDLPIPQDI